MFGISSMYGGYSGYGLSSMMPNYSQINDMKLLTAVNRRLSGAGSSASSRKTTSLDTKTTDFLKEYQNRMSDLLQKADALRADNQNSVAGQLAVQSSDTDVMTANVKYRLSEAAAYDVRVTQLAAAQKNVSTGVESTGNDALSGSLVIATGDRASPITIDVGSISGRDNYEKLQNVAKEVNRYKSDVSARVVVNEGRASLEITGTKTGRSNSFNVTGSFAASSGLDQVSQAAQNAEYSVARQGDAAGAYTYQSESNTVNIGSYKMQATFRKTGEATLTTGVDNKKTADALGDLVKSYNSALKLLNDNASRGAGVLQQMRRMVQPPVSEQSMKQVGITANKDGTLNFDRDTFLKQAELYPAQTHDIVSGSYSIASGMRADAKAGMNISSSRLTGTNPAGSRYSGASWMQMQNSYLQNPLNYFSTYNSSGMVNLFNNNSVGLLMNINI